MNALAGIVCYYNLHYHIKLTQQITRQGYSMSSTVTATINSSVRLPRPTSNPDLGYVHVYDLTKAGDKRAQTLGQLLREGHSAVAPLRNPQLILHSHLPHVSREIQRLALHTHEIPDIGV